ncbi:hypothetical protein BO86DRAFT_387004 [Aspergillus japonicus CBS 114.51]|uniref:MADS-box domain-containing protein n=2 Tax=Aspergillus subgen. Circumdati TaxID=2720871 RepID=A0A395HNE7_ASPHC|nr:hypothetical protein BO86DRAFT_387004 [Aspergillus japonicus CBS 114.51]XP_025548605.1 hypothetical protein BO97DRAFT_407769 [Aspergillus homomorphus CBS 101889]RAH84381.1 hypothetical protein BO86DRAFT_387004 [Aspergillus japonicus CBS 114.51]RAL09451.1 hypothetical protein BO97DRAFT_407769 [Aspergillus homomorphus CBS 101889]
MANVRTIRGRHSDNPRSKRQQRLRRRLRLMFGAFEYCHECDADISLLIRLKDTGQIYIFNSDSQWQPSKEQLASYYPKPKQVTWEELASKYRV